MSSTTNSQRVHDSTLKILMFGYSHYDFKWLDATQIISKKYGFTYHYVGRAETQELIDSLRTENEKTRMILEKRNGIGWQAKFNNEVEKMKALLIRANKHLKESQPFKNIKSYFDANDLGLCWYTYPSSESDKNFDVSIYTLRFFMEYTKNERYYLLSIDLNTEMVTVKDSIHTIKIFSNRS